MKNKYSVKYIEKTIERLNKLSDIYGFDDDFEDAIEILEDYKEQIEDE